MTVPTARRVVGSCALIAFLIAVYTAWNLMWATSGLGALIDDLSAVRVPEQPPTLTYEQARAKVNGYALWTLNRLSAIVPISLLCLAVLLGIVAARMQPSRAKEAPK
ncbi:MAG: hypothetical protein IT438_06305 [Phycisphaerales bacterium]|nr:hypothetical protein [Phycisphaerales bacterium]